MKQYRRPLWFSLATNLTIVLGDLVASPLHARGYGQDVLGYFGGAAHILGLPGFTAAGCLKLRPSHDWTWSAFWVELAFNLVFWVLTPALCARLKSVFEGRAAAAASAPTESQPGTPQKTFSRRQLMLGGGRAVAGTGMATGSWGFFGEARWFEITRRQIPIKGLLPALDGLRIVHLTDIHHGAWMSLRWVRQIVDAANALMPDVVALTGDYVYRGADYVRPVARELARLRPRIGTVGVMGNHDWGGHVDDTRRAFADAGLPLIDNTRLFVTPARKLVPDARHGLCLAGVGDLWEDKCLYAPALGHLPGGMPRVLLSHNPDVAEEPDFLRSGYRVDLMLCGHTHGGQISLPGVGAPVTNSAYGQRYARGLVQGPICPVFVSRGLGMTVMPVRVGVRPEIAVIELRTA